MISTLASPALVNVVLRYLEEVSSKLVNNNQVCKLQGCWRLVPMAHKTVSICLMPDCFPQDTVVALQALAKYATTVYVLSEEVNLTVKSAQNFQHTFNVQAANRLLFQQETLPDIPGVYTLEASGQGCVYVQVSRAPGGLVCVGKESLRASLPLVEPSLIYLICKESRSNRTLFLFFISFLLE